MNCKFAVFSILAAALPLAAKDFYVAPTGDDAGPGSDAAPFATVMRGQHSAEAGDTVFIRGGTYKMTEAMTAGRERNRILVINLSKSGKVGTPINYFSYMAEKPVFDFSDVKPKGLRVTAFNVDRCGKLSLKRWVSSP